MFWPEEGLKGFQPLVYLEEVVLRKDHYALIVKMKDIWQGNAINLNDVTYVERRAIVGHLS